MAYATGTTILTLLPGLPQSLGSAGYDRVISLVDSHVDRADNLVNAKISNRYNVSGFNTSGSVPPVLRTLSEDITAYYSYRSLFSSDGQNDNEWTDKCKDAIDILNEIREGTMDLVDSSGSMIATRASATVDDIGSTTEDWTATFGEDDPLSWVVDSDKLDSIKDDRT